LRNGFARGRLEVRVVSDNPGQNGFPQRLQDLRQRLYWSQQELSEQAGVSRKTIWNWEHGETAPRTSSWQLKRVAEVLRVPLGTLVYGEEKRGNA